MIKLIITDLDGTFLNSHGDYDRQSFLETRRLMADQGVHFAACTGKQCERVEELFDDNCQDVWIVGDSATRIKHNGEIVFQSLINNTLGLAIISTLQKVSTDHVIIACTPEGAIVHSATPPHLKEKVRRSYTRMIETDDFSTVRDDFIKITVFDEQGRCPLTRPHLAPFEDDVYIVVSEASWIDIADYGIHKGTTVQKLQQILGVTAEETMAFGDGYNDIELLAEADYSFAMRNAFDETKAAARFVTGTNDENAVMETIKRMLALQA
jgi:Cof subfamily protein (haloacid dehalogenase superfamily)